MKNSKSTASIALVLGIILLAFLFFLLRNYLKDVDVILLLLFPIAISLISYLFADNDFKELKEEIIKELKISKEEVVKELKTSQATLIKEIDKERLVCHGTKYGFPNRQEFWNKFLYDAKREFLLLGTTNHSWVSGGNDQSRLFGDAIVRILENGGVVKILSQDEKETKRKHEIFIEQYVLKRIHENVNKERLLVIFRKNFSYKFKSNLSFTAVVSDDRLIILPKMNNEKVHEKSMVLELNHSLEEVYKNYKTDIETVFELAPTMKFDTDALIK